MTFEELRDRIKEKLILEKGETQSYQWEQWGISSSASELGFADGDFFSLVSEITKTVPFSLIDEVESEIVRLAKNKRIMHEDEERIFSKALPLEVSKSFVKEHWVPRTLEAAHLVELEEEKELESVKDLPVTRPELVEVLDEVPSATEEEIKKLPGTEGVSGTSSDHRPYALPSWMKRPQFRSGVVAVTIICIACVYLYRESGVRHSQNEMEMILSQGMNFAMEKGLHDDADAKFGIVRKMLIEDPDLDTVLVRKAITKLKLDGDRFCDLPKDSTVIAIANQYYRHVSILSNTRQIICK